MSSNNDMLPYHFDSRSMYTGQPQSHFASAPLSSRRPDSSAVGSSSSMLPHHALTVAEWAGTKGASTCSMDAPTQESGDWRDVHRNIKRMDQLYDATFYTWLKSEDNVLVTAMYLHRIANEYPLERIANALKWLVADWRWESTSILVRHVTVDWCDKDGDFKRAYLLRHLTQNWATQYTATLITTILATPPYLTADNGQRERFLRAFTEDWDFSKLSEFFMYLQSRANVDYKLKCIMLQEAARRERETLSAKLNSRKKRLSRQESAVADKAQEAALPATEDKEKEDAVDGEEWRHHHRRTSSNDAADMNKRFRRSRNDLDDKVTAVEPDQPQQASSSSSSSPSSSSSSSASASSSSASAIPSSSASVGCISSTASPGPSPSTSSNTTSRRAATPDYQYQCDVSEDNTPDGGDLLHLARAQTAAPAAASSSASAAAAAAAATVVDVFSRCYQSASSASTPSHLQVHGFRLHRRSSSSSSTTSTASAASSAAAAPAADDEAGSSSMKKRSTPVNNQDTTFYR